MELWRDKQEAAPAVAITNALILMRRALAMLDDSECPGEIGAHLDLAAVRLEEWMLGGAQRAVPDLASDLASGTYT